jgi:type IV pilus assembly protein PilX
MNSSLSFRSARQKGFVLITVLLLVLMLTVLAIAIVSLNTGQTRLATNGADSEVAFQTAEGALNQGVYAALSGALTSTQFAANTGGYYTYNPSAAPLWTTINWSSSSAVVTSFQGNASSAAAYIIELMPSVIKAGQDAKDPTLVYRITARGTGQSSNSVSILQTLVTLQQ